MTPPQPPMTVELRHDSEGIALAIAIWFYIREHESIPDPTVQDLTATLRGLAARENLPDLLGGTP